MHYIKAMFDLKKCMIFPLVAAAALYAGIAAYAAGAEPVSVPEIAATLPGDASVSHIDLNAPDKAPEGVIFSGDTVTITAAGIYRLTGSLSGQVIVDANGPTELILAGASLRGEACLQSTSKDALTLTLEDGTLNVLADGLTDPDDNAQAPLAVKGTLTIGGSGTLTVVAGGGDGLKCKGGLTVSGGSLYIKAADEGADVSGPLTIAGGDIRVIAGGDGLAAENDRIDRGCITVTGGALSITSQSRGLDAKEGSILITGGTVTIDSVDDGLRAVDISQSGGSLTIETHGYTPEDATAEEAIAGDGIDGDTVSLSGGTLTITSTGDGIQALTDLTITDGRIAITSGGGGGNASSHAGDSFMMGPWNRSSSTAAAASVSAKGLKSDGDITITGGVIDLNTSDDSIHGVRLCTVAGGTLSLCSSDDGIHCDDMLVISDGDITITDCFEGLEAFAIEVHGGSTSVRAVNDGVNANGPEGWGWGGNTSVTDSVSGYSTTYYWQSAGTVDLVVTGDYSNMGDGMDSNGSLYVTGGCLTVSTPGTFMENGMDSGSGYFIISGGQVMAGGASMMQPTPSSNTDQCVAVISSGSAPDGSLVTLLDSEGTELWSHTLENSFTCLVLSHPSMTLGNTYTVTYGTQTITLDFTSKNVVSTGGSSGMGGFGGGMGRRP